MRNEQVTAPQLQEALGQLSLMCSQNLGGQRAVVVIRDPNGHTLFLRRLHLHELDDPLQLRLSGGS